MYIHVEFMRQAPCSNTVSSKHPPQNQSCLNKQTKHKNKMRHHVKHQGYGAQRATPLGGDKSHFSVDGV